MFPLLFKHITTSLDFVRFTIYLPNRIGLLANITKTQTCCRHLAIDTHLQRFRHSRTREPHPTTEELGEPKSEHDIEANHLHHRGTICKMLNTEVFFNTEAGVENGIFVKMVTISTCWMSWTCRVVYFKTWLSQVIQLSSHPSHLATLAEELLKLMKSQRNIRPAAWRSKSWDPRWPRSKKNQGF